MNGDISPLSSLENEMTNNQITKRYLYYIDKYV